MERLVNTIVFFLHNIYHVEYGGDDRIVRHPRVFFCLTRRGPHRD